MNQIEKALSDYLGEMCGMRLKPHALTGLAKAAIAAMPVQSEPVAWMYERKPEEWPPSGPVVQRTRWRMDDPARPFWIEHALYAHPPAQWQGIESARRNGERFWGYWPVQNEDDRQCVTYFDQFTADGPRFVDVADHIDWTQPTHWMPLPTPPAGGSDAE